MKTHNRMLDLINKMEARRRLLISWQDKIDMDELIAELKAIEISLR